MTTRQIVHELENKGYSVEYYVRKDGGILITKINGVKYSGAKGNVYARNVLGIALSQRRAVQLTRASKSRAKKRHTDVSVPDELKKQFRKVQKKWREDVSLKKTGQPTMKKLRWRLKYEGYESAKSLLNEWEKYTRGIAYEGVVKALKDSIQNFADKTGNKKLEKLANDIWDNRDSIRMEWVEPAWDTLYELNKGGDPSEIIAEVRTILRLPE